MTIRFLADTRILLASFFRRVVRAWGWLVLQLAGLAALIVSVLAWTRISEKHWIQVFLTFAIPIVIAAGFLFLLAGAIRSFLRPLAADPLPRAEFVPFAWGAATLLLWIAIAIVAWGVMNRFDDQTYTWAGYLNSRFSSGARARWASYPHLVSDLERAGWTLRWVVLPGLLIPLTCTSALGFRRIPWGRAVRTWLNWRWWPCLLVAALIGEAWPQTFFDPQPSGTVHAQVWRVILKLAGAYALAVVVWVATLAWAATLLAGIPARRRTLNDDALLLHPDLVPSEDRNDAPESPQLNPGENIGGNA